MNKFEWRVDAPGFIASGTDVEPFDALHHTGCAVLKAGPKSEGVIVRDGKLWRTVHLCTTVSVTVVKLSGDEVEFFPLEL